MIFRPMKYLIANVALVAAVVSITPCSALSLGREPFETQASPHGGSDGYLNRRDVMKDAAAATSAGLASYVLSPNGLALPASAASISPAIPTVKLGGSPLEVSRTIQGYWQLAGKHGDYKEEDALENMRAHFEAGITTLDTADIYGESERIMGKFVKMEKAAIPCTKFCCFRNLEDINKEQVRKRIIKQCDKLQVSKLPLVAFFWSNYDVKRYVDVALMLTELKGEGLIKQIGATNFDLKRLKELKAAGVPIVSNQVQLSAMDRRPVQSGMADWCSENNVSLIAFGTVGSGILSERYLGQPAPAQEQKNTASMRMYSKTAERFGNWGLLQELLQTMNAIAADVRSSGRCEEATIANVAQRYILEGKAVASVLIGVRNKKHIAENVRSHSFQLTDGERSTIDAVVAKRNGPRGDVWDIERGNI